MCDVVVCWPKDVDYPWFRQRINRDRHLFDKLIIVMTQKATDKNFTSYIKANMDAFWADFGGKPANKTVYSIPLIYERKSIESIRTNKRSMYKHRYQVLDNIEQQLRLALAQ